MSSSSPSSPKPSGIGSERPVPRRSMRITRAKLPRRSRKRASAGSSKKCSTCEMKPGENSRSTGPLPSSVQASVAWPLRAYLVTACTLPCSLRPGRVRLTGRRIRRHVIVDCAYYKDGKRQHEGPLDLDKAAAAATPTTRASSGSGCTSPTTRRWPRCRSASTCTRWPSRTPSTPTSARSWRTTGRRLLHRAADGPLRRRARGGRVRRDPHLRRPRLCRHRAPWRGERPARRAPAPRGAS